MRPITKQLRRHTFFTHFWIRVDIGEHDACWLWTGKTYDGYGRCTEGRAHRFAWEIYYDREIPCGMQILHECDTPLCCNPRHLKLGTHAVNMADKARRGRAYSGQSHHWSKSFTVPLAALSQMG